MKHFTSMQYTPDSNYAKYEFDVNSIKYRLVIPQKYATNPEVISYIFDNFDIIVQPNSDFTVPDVDFDKIMKE